MYLGVLPPQALLVFGSRQLALVLPLPQLPQRLAHGHVSRHPGRVLVDPRGPPLAPPRSRRPRDLTRAAAFRRFVIQTRSGLGRRVLFPSSGAPEELCRQLGLLRAIILTSRSEKPHFALCRESRPIGSKLTRASSAAASRFRPIAAAPRTTEIPQRGHPAPPGVM